MLLLVIYFIVTLFYFGVKEVFQVEYVILGLLMIKGLTLYEINKSFKQGICLFYSASYGSLQFSVKKLLSRGFVSVEAKLENGRNKRIYSITDTGRIFFHDWMLSREIPSNKLETIALTKLYFLGLIRSKENKKEILSYIIDKINETQTELVAMNKALCQHTIPKSYEDIFHFQLKSLDYGINAHQFSRQWFEEVLESLDKLTE